MTRAELIERIMEKAQKMNPEEFDEFLSFLRGMEADDVDCKNREPITDKGGRKSMSEINLRDIAGTSEEYIDIINDTAEDIEHNLLGLAKFVDEFAPQIQQIVRRVEVIEHFGIHIKEALVAIQEA